MTIKNVRVADDGGRLYARPTAPEEAASPGLHRLSVDRERDGLLYVPTGYHPDTPAPLAVMLHGANGNAQHGLALLMPHADRLGLLLLAPESAGETWDMVLGDGYGADVELLDTLLDDVFAHCAVDPARVAIGGFSDGASYALSLGVMNGDLFTHVVVFSPGFMAPAGQRGTPRLFLSHGTRDGVLSVDSCSRRIVPQMRRLGYDLQYHEFDGGHTVPPDIAVRAAEGFVGAPAEN